MAAYNASVQVSIRFDARGDRNHALLIQTNRACEPDATVAAYCNMLRMKACLHTELGQHTQAMASLRQADEVFIYTDRKGLLQARDQYIWRQIFNAMGGVYLGAHQLESAKQCYIKVLAWPGISVVERMYAHFGLARYHKERKDWVSLIKSCEEALTLRRQVTGHIGQTEEKLLLMLADAAEAQGDLKRA